MRYFPIAIAALVAVAAAVLASSTHAAPTAPRGFFGIVPNRDLRAADYRLMQEGRVGSARVSVSWRAIEPSEGKFDWESADTQVGEFAARGIGVLPNLYGIPEWLAETATTPPVSSDLQRRAWERFVGEAVGRYGQGGTFWRTVYPLRYPGAQPQPITTWQVWNEQNGPKHFSPTPNVTNYATLLGIASRAVRAVNPDARILTGGMASEPTGEGGIKASTFVKALARTKEGRKSFDDVAIHPYARNSKVIASQVKKMRRVLKKRRKKKARVWITEVGWSSAPNGVSPKLSKSLAGQAKQLKKTYRLLKKKRRRWKIGGVYWYTWRDFDGGVCDWCPDAGLVTAGLQPKPAFNVYRKLAR